MAIDYDLVFGSPASVNQVAQHLREGAQHGGLLDPETTADRLAVAPGQQMVNGSVVVVLDGTPRRPWNAVRDDLGFTPTVIIGFRLNSQLDIRQQQDDIVRLTSELLDRIPGDAVLHRELEQIWLLRRDGELSISERTDIWPPHRLGLITQSYTRATYTFA